MTPVWLQQHRPDPLHALFVYHLVTEQGLGVMFGPAQRVSGSWPLVRWRRHSVQSAGVKTRLSVARISLDRSMTRMKGGGGITLKIGELKGSWSGGGRSKLNRN